MPIWKDEESSNDSDSTSGSQYTKQVNYDTKNMLSAQEMTMLADEIHDYRIGLPRAHAHHVHIIYSAWVSDHGARRDEPF